MRRVIAVMACGFSLAACSASLPSLSFMKSSPPMEALRIESDPPGAEAKISSGQSCRTPCELTVDAAGELAVTLALVGYQPQTISVRPAAPGPQGQGGVSLAPNPVFVELLPTPAAPAKKPATPKKRKPIAAAERSAPPPASAAAPPPMPSTAAEPAASATNFPWPSR